MIALDPIEFCRLCWPEMRLYDKQREILYSVRDNDETFVPAGNALGKDFVAALCALWFFVTRRPAKVVTTSVKGDQLNDVLWAEMRRFVDTSRHRLPILYNHLLIRQLRADGSLEPRSSLTGQVVQKGESLLGRHIERTSDGLPRTLAIFDEASGIDDQAYESSDTWTHRKLIIGNPYPCTNFFYKGVKAGDLAAPGNGHLYRKVIRIRALDSPNIKWAQAEEARKQSLSGKVLVPGVIDYATYLKRRELWDPVRQCIGLDAEFYEGAEVLLFPPEWLNRAERRADELKYQRRTAKAIGVDPAEGGDKTSRSAVDELGLIEQESRRTPNTAVIPGETLAFARKHGVSDENIVFDIGGGGKEHADLLRSKGHNVRTVAFGSAAAPEKKRGVTVLADRKLQDEVRYVYKNRRAEMYGDLHLLLDPSNRRGFGLPVEYTELRRQLSPIPRTFDGEGRLVLPPKRKPTANSTVVTLTELIGCSPDEADSLVLAVYGMTHKATRRTVGVAF